MVHNLSGSKYVLEYKLNEIKFDNDFYNGNRHANFSNLNLTSLQSQETYFAFFKQVNLGNNRLAKRLYQLSALRECIELDLSNNSINSLKEFPVLPNLKVLRLKGNNISNVKEINSLLDKLCLIKIDLRDNPIFDNDEVIKSLQANFNNIKLEI